LNGRFSFFKKFIKKCLQFDLKINIIKLQIKKINSQEKNAMENQALLRLEAKEINKREAYRELFPEAGAARGPKKAHFITLRIRIPEERGVNLLLGFLFALPIPLALAKMILKRVNLGEDTLPLEKEELLRLVAVRGLKVDIRTKDGVRVFIKTI
jgi:hypothetical protein